MAYENLADKRANLLTQAQAIATELAEKGGVLEGEAKQQFDSLVAEAGTIAEAIRAEKAASEARAAADAGPAREVQPAASGCGTAEGRSGQGSVEVAGCVPAEMRAASTRLARQLRSMNR